MSHPSIYDGCYLPTIAVHAFDVEFWGKSSHAAMAPWKGLNALDALIQAFNNINALRQSILPTMRIHGIIVEGGKAENIIPFNHPMSYSDS
jgi:metal-dependent amidase/aminoacylase/carboxypeptidase family protein